MNIKDGPASGSTPNEKHAGKIINPASKAINVSKEAIVNASLVNVFSLDMYDPKISIAAIPNDNVKNA